MALSNAIKRRIAQRIDTLLGGDGTRTDFSGAVADAVSAMQAAGWQVVDGRIARRFAHTVTRDAAHQAYVERLGQVQPGQNTYEQVVAQAFEARIGDQFREVDGGAVSTISTVEEARAVALLSALRKRPIPSTWLRWL
jgi:hypothetical protein